MTDLVMGVDGGGTKTELAVADREGRLLLHRIGPGIGPIETPHWPAVLAQLMQEVRPLSLRLGEAAFGMPSYGEIPEVSAAQAAAAAACGIAGHSVINDVHLAYEGAFLGKPGVLLLVGTGSMVWACNAAGRHIRVGGWGHGYGDEGSAFWIGQQAATMLSHCLDGRAQDMDFAAAMADHLGLPAEGRAEALAAWYYADPDPRVKVAALSRMVDRLAEQGNATAKAILIQAAVHLAMHVRAAWNRLPSLPLGVWSAAGSVMQSRTLSAHLSRLLETPPIAPMLPPVGGALWRAARAAGWRVDAAWIDRLRDQLSHP